MNMLGINTGDVGLLVRKRVTGFRIPDEPAMDAAALPVFTESLKNARHYLEYGAGGSTVLAARLGKRGLSIEGDFHYHRDVQKKLRGLPETMKLTYVNVGRTWEWGKLVDTYPHPWRLESWERYVMTPFRDLADDFYDLVLIDGRFRVACALQTLSEAIRRKASLRMLVDDYNTPDDPRPHYRMIEHYAPLARLAGNMAVFDITPETASTPPEDLLKAVMLDSR